MTKSFITKVSYDCIETVNAENLDDSMELAKIQVAKDLALGMRELDAEEYKELPVLSKLIRRCRHATVI